MQPILFDSDFEEHVVIMGLLFYWLDCANGWELPFEVEDNFFNLLGLKVD